MATTSILGIAVLVTSNQLASTNDMDLSAGKPMGAEIVEVDPDALKPVKQVPNMTPDVSAVGDDVADVYADGCHVDDTSIEFDPCIYGNPDSNYVVAIVGDSHAAQWIPALQEIALHNDWRLETYTKSACALNTVAVNANGSFYESCYGWGENILRHLTGTDAPDHVIASASTYSASDILEVPQGVRTGDVGEGFQNAWTQIQDTGVGLTVILDTPRPRMDVPECIAENEENLTECAADRAEAVKFSGQARLLKAAEAAGTETVDMTDSICSPDACAPVVGGVIVWRDSHHITATYAETLAGSLERALREESSLDFSRDST